MAELTPKRIIKANINSGQQYQDGDGVQAQTITDVVQGILYSDQISNEAIGKANNSETNSLQAQTIAVAANEKSYRAESNSEIALSISNEAKQESNLARAFSNTANENSQTARGLAQSVLDMANSGELDGKSAYEIAVSKGFIGTETEWLAALKGTNGIDGKNGANGVIINENIFLGFEQQQEYDEGIYTIYPIKVLAEGSIEFTATSTEVGGFTETTITVTGV